MGTTMNKVYTAAIGVVTVSLMAAGCGNNKKADSASDTTRYCELARTMAAPPTGIDPATATPDQLMAAAKKHFADHLNDIAELERVAPAKVRADIAVYARVARHIAVTGKIDEFDTPENAPAISRQEAFDKSVCGIQPPTGP